MATTIVNSRVGSSVNNGRLQPLQGLDTVVYIQDQATGNVIEFGEFTGFQYTIRNSTEPYMPLGSKTITYLDGEYQIGWVLEQGKINIEALPQLIGYDMVSPIIRIGRSPRFQIIVEYNAKELDNTDRINSFGAGAAGATITGNDGSTRIAKGRYIFTMCKVDAFTSGAMAGRQAIADRIEGLAEGWQYVNTTDKFNPTEVLAAQSGTDVGTGGATSPFGYSNGTARLWGVGGSNTATVG